jgi:hypothetical protein
VPMQFAAAALRVGPASSATICETGTRQSG